MCDERVVALLSYAEGDGRICPQPPEWNQLWELLPARCWHDGGWLPRAPLILAGWWASTDDQKAERLAYHIRWAYDCGALGPVERFLRQLSQERWHCRRGIMTPKD